MKADYVIKNAQLYMTFRKCFEKRDLAVAGAYVLAVLPEISRMGAGAEFVGEHTAFLDAEGRYLIPGFVDIHMHIESSMTYPEEFSRVTLPFGTTTVVADSHEIANVFGMEGIRTFLDQKTELDIFCAIPSSVPATNACLETAGAEIGEAEVRELLDDSRVLCLGEVMNYQDVVSEDVQETKIRRLIRICRETRGRDIRLEGHCPKISGAGLNRFIGAGIDADHTQQTPESVLEKTDLGMFLELQRKSLTPAVVRTVCENQLYENVALVTDDIMPDMLLEGQLNRIVRAAVEAGMPAEEAIYCATYTPARRMHLDDRGILGPGKLADFMLLENLRDFVPEAVFKRGKKVTASEWRKSCRFPEHFYHSIHCREAVPEDFCLRVSDDRMSGGKDHRNVSLSSTDADCPSYAVTANVMKISTFGTMTEAVRRQIPVRDGVICWQEAGLCMAVIYERYGKNGNISHALVEGALKQRGAVAATLSHDSHNLLVLGNSPEDMVLVQRRLVEMQGGYAAAAGGKILAEAALPVGGILSDGPLEKLAEDLGAVRAAMEQLGYENNNVIMSMSTLALPVSPALKLTDYGLLDVKTQKPVELMIE